MLAWMLACGGPSDPSSTPTPTDAGSTPATTSDSGWTGPVEVLVTLDGAPVVARVYADGEVAPRWTDDQGRLWLDAARVVVASHDEARTEGADVEGGRAVVALERYALDDNEAYTFQDPGRPDDRDDASRCAHCHLSQVEDWLGSAHATSASNPVVQDVYAGTAGALDTAACVAAGGTVLEGLAPGTRAPVDRCYVGAGTLPDLDPSCAATPCDAVATRTGGCADCHAPGIDGALGGRDLLEATGLAYRYGVHCDVCHKVDEVDVEAADRGVAGALRLLRPTETSLTPGLPWRALTFGPYDDVANPRMGSVARHLFHEAELCGGCHELRQEVLVPGAAADPARWPDGRLPVHTTYDEWATGPLSPVSPCNSCHLPPDPGVANAADLEPGSEDEGVTGGWPRPPGSVRHHTFDGPRRPEAGMLALAAAVDLSTSVAAGRVTAEVTVTNAGAGHALPTGEPLRALLLEVTARCGAEPLDPVDGDALPAWTGALALGPVGTRWPGARVGDRIRVVERTGGFRDDPGWGPFGDGTFSPAEKGLPVELVRGEREVVGVSGDTVTLDAPLPAGTYAVRVPGPGADPLPALAGAPGRAFARVLADRDGALMVPHHRAVDVVADNRLLPQASSTSTHTFVATCAAPQVTATLRYRPLPRALATERGWDAADTVVVEVTR
ncbi:MAG: hypothetical protein H6735_15185 [Alphaproteobacteria bacterium]|nr:hypothetical protein [Alphaproteobacteria bacterium]